ncbi:uncharacterized protein A4U43_C08F29320 [Asparagus officinalis]|nr:uncharacterized protein A4U43_C08F29320 [Asparagus officinalis]
MTSVLRQRFSQRVETEIFTERDREREREEKGKKKSAMSTLALSSNGDFSAEHKAPNCKRLKKLVGDECVASLRCINKGTNVSSWDVARLRQENTKKILKEKKLMLILDLDNTLLHSVRDGDLSSEDERLMQMRESSEDERGRSVFRWRGMATKLRPHVRSFLKEASKMFDMYIYTMACREYALQIAEFLDPEGVYFENKILSSEDCTRPRRKGLDVVLGEEKAMVIVDDNDKVWGKHVMNQIDIKRYHFFGPKRPLFDLDGNALSEMEELESKESELARCLELLRCIHWLFFNPVNHADFYDSDVRQILMDIKDEVEYGSGVGLKVQCPC